MRRAFFVSALAIACAGAAFGQAPTTTSTEVTLARPSAAMPPTGFRAEYAAEVDNVGKKLVDLAEAIPADKYSWRPAPGVRSISEVFMHVVGGNSHIPTFLGAKPMSGVTRESEKTVTDKAQVVALLKRSVEHAKSIATTVPDADLEKKVKTFGGREMTERQVLTLIENHLHEHLGQAIAYARINGVTPPWSQS